MMMMMISKLYETHKTYIYAVSLITGNATRYTLLRQPLPCTIGHTAGTLQGPTIPLRKLYSLIAIGLDDNVYTPISTTLLPVSGVGLTVRYACKPLGNCIVRIKGKVRLNINK